MNTLKQHIDELKEEISVEAGGNTGRNPVISVGMAKNYIDRSVVLALKATKKSIIDLYDGWPGNVLMMPNKQTILSVLETLWE